MDENTTKKIQALKNKIEILDALLSEPVEEKKKIYKALELIGSEIAKIKETQKLQNPEIEEIAAKLEQIRDMVREIPAEFPEEVKVSNLKDLPPPQVKVETKEVRVSNLHELPRPKVEVPENLKEFNFKTLIKILENGFLGMVKQLTQKVTLTHRRPEEYIPVRLSDGKLFYEAFGGGGGVAGGPVVSKSVEAVTDWTSVAQNTVSKSGIIDCSGHAATLLCIQAALNTTTAHNGTRFIVQVSSNTSGDEDWQDYTEFIGLAGTAVADNIEDNPLPANSTSITLTANTYTALAKWLFIKDATLVNSELIFEIAQTTNAITLLDGTTNAHASGTAIYNIALSQVVMVDPSVNRARVLVDNTYSATGSSLNYKVRVSKATSL